MVMLDKLNDAARLHPPAIAVDLASLADHVFTVFEGGYILTPAMDDAIHLPTQLEHVRAHPGRRARNREAWAAWPSADGHALQRSA
jgi:hypothetical protein